MWLYNLLPKPESIFKIKGGDIKNLGTTQGVLFFLIHGLITTLGNDVNKYQVNNNNMQTACTPQEYKQGCA